jgi:hypothetical protein
MITRSSTKKVTGSSSSKNVTPTNESKQPPRVPTIRKVICKKKSMLRSSQSSVPNSRNSSTSKHNQMAQN